MLLIPRNISIGSLRFHTSLSILINMLTYRGRRGARAQGCDYNATVVGSITTRGNELLFINILALISKTQYAIPLKIQLKLGHLNTRFTQPTLLCVGYMLT